MKVLGKAIAALAQRLEGQLMLALPDEAPIELVRSILTEANALRRQDPPYAVAAYQNREDLESAGPAYGFRQLPEIRQGSHLVVVFSSDYKAWSTFKGVYPFLLSASFPGDDRQVGSNRSVCGLADVGDEVAAALEGLLGQRVPTQDLRESVTAILRFLAEAYASEGNSTAGWTSKWWSHVCTWLDSIEKQAAEAKPFAGAGSFIDHVFGSAGLPRPDNGVRYQQRKPEDFVRILQERWHTSEVVGSELDRLERRVQSPNAVAGLRHLPWASELGPAYQVAESRIGAVCGVGRTSDERSHARAWASLPEEAFFSRPTVSNEMVVRRAGRPLPKAWPESPYLLAVELEDSQEAEGVAAINGLEIVVPIGDVDEAMLDSPEGAIDINELKARVSGFRGAIVTVVGVIVSDRLATVTVNMILQNKRPPAAPVALTLIADGRSAECIGDQSTCRICVVFPMDALLLVAPVSGHLLTSRRLEGECRWHHHGHEPPSVGLINSGLRRIAVFHGGGRSLVPGQIKICPHRPEADFITGEYPRLFHAGPLSLDGEDTIRIDETVAFEFEAIDRRVRPLSPLAAACYGVRPNIDQRPEVLQSPLGEIESELVKLSVQLDSSSEHCSLGEIALSSAATRSGYVLDMSGIVTTEALAPLLASRFPRPPSDALRRSSSAKRLAAAFKKLDIPGRIARIEQDEEASGLIPSRISFRDVTRVDVDELLDAYSDYVSEADRQGSASDRFWSRFPMSVAIYSEAPGSPVCEAILLSCLHPIRFAWRWEMEAAFACVSEETGQIPAMARLTEGWTFPAIASIHNELGSGETPLVSMPIDHGPDQVFIGWSALAPVRGDGMPEEPRTPEMINGGRFPSGASSGLSDTAVTGAIREFVRVFPHVRTLSVELPMPEKRTRAIAIDRSIGHALQSLTSGPDGAWILPGGVRVFDSSWRLGPLPDPKDIVPRNVLGKPIRKFEWEVFDPAGERRNVPINIRFAQSQATLMAAARVGQHRAAIPKIPLRRFPRRSRSDNGVIIDYSMEAKPGDSPFTHALERVEQWSREGPMATRVTTGAALRDVQSADWTVTGDAGLDPAGLQAFVVEHCGTHLLWEWRPAVAVGPDSLGLALEQRAYVTISKLPSAFSVSLRQKIEALIPGAETPNVDACVGEVIRRLAQRGIGLNSLLAMGHQHATGALGFFLAFSLLRRWCDEAPPHEIRCLVPVDAIDALLRVVVGNATVDVGSKKRADILAIQATDVDGLARLTLIPIEVKHYGLVDGEAHTGFPMPGEASLAEHLEQLRIYAEFLRAIKRTRDGVSDTHRNLIDVALGAVLDAAFVLDPTLRGSEDPFLLRAVADGCFNLETARGLLLWFQKGGGDSGGRSVSLELLEASDHGAHAELFVDPLGHYGELWNGDGRAAFDSLKTALDWCAKEDGESHLVAKPSKPHATQPEDVADGGVKAGSFGTGSISMTVPPVAQPPEPDSSEGGGQQMSPTQVPMSQDRGLGVEELRKRYGQVLNTFREYKIMVEAPADESERYSEGPASIIYSVRPGRGVPASRIQQRLDDLKLRLNLPDGQNIGSFIDQGLVRLDVPKPDKERYFVDAEDMWRRWSRPAGGFKIPIGEDREGRVVDVDLSNPNSPHLLIAGTTGSGKSEALLTLLGSATKFYSPVELRLLLVDPKGTELRPFESSDYLLGKIGWDSEEAQGLLDRAISEMERRYNLFRNSESLARDLGDYNKSCSSDGVLPRWLVVLDEYADLTSDPKDKVKIEERIKRLSQKARAAGIHLIVCTQKPVVTVINTVVKGNLPAQLALRTKSVTESQVIMNAPGAETLTGMGDAFLNVGGTVTRVQCAKWHRGA